MSTQSADRKGLSQVLVAFTERVLTRRLKKKLKEKMRQQARHPVLDWIYAILWAACVVLVVNQYVFQNYRIPSSSMEKTLLIGDMIFVDKLSFGPELLPGVGKLTGAAAPKRGQIIVFENPTYLSKGPVFTILQQMIYMLTLTLVDIDKDELGEPRVHYLIKRAVGYQGDRIRVEKGEVSIMPRGASEFLDESRLMADLGLDKKAVRLVEASEYSAIESTGFASAYKEAGLKIPSAIASASSQAAAYKDAFGFDAARIKALRGIDPSDSRIAAASRRFEMGWFVPEGRIFPMGDNRDNSRDARYFGPVATDRVLGRALFIYWPLSRAGRIR
ncbi:MAG TPA: signal peptidase I [Rectinemataceae bacterium]